MRLNRFLAQCGLGSRRKCEEIIQSGRVKIGGNVVTDLATLVKEIDRIMVDNRLVTPLEMTYILLNKPAGYITTMREQFGRQKVSDLVNNLSVKPVGRLDMATSGVLIMTNDGELSFRLTHPKYAIARIYQVTITGSIPSEYKYQIADGIDIGNGQTAHGRILGSRYLEGYSRITIEIKEGLNREVRRIFEILGHKVISLDRISFGGLRYAGLERGQWRNLTEKEVSHLRKLVGLE